MLDIAVAKKKRRVNDFCVYDLHLALRHASMNVCILKEVVQKKDC